MRLSTASDVKENAMTRKGLFTAMIASGALLTGVPAEASQTFGVVGGIVNQLYYNSSLSGNGFTFTIYQNGKPTVLFSGLSGLQQFNNLGALNSWAHSGGSSGSQGYSYTPTYTGTGSYFGTSGGGATPQGYNYAPTFTGTGSYFGTSGGSGQTYAYTPTFTAVGSFFDEGEVTVTPQVFVSPPVPELGTWAMMLSGFFAIGSVLRRRKGAANFA
jgi:hypothetical protein